MLSASKKQAIKTYFEDEIEPNLRYTRTPQEVDQTIGMYMSDIDSLMRESGWSWSEREEGWAYLDVLTEPYKRGMLQVTSDDDNVIDKRPPRGTGMKSVMAVAAVGALGIAAAFAMMGIFLKIKESA